jgi:hypothetical protein
MSEPGLNVYAAFIDAELKAENDRRTSVNTRAATALTGATGLVTLVLAVFAVLGARNDVVLGAGKDFVLTGWAKAFLVVALAALLGSAACAVAAGFPWRQKLISPRTLHKMLTSHRNDAEDVATDAVAYCNVAVIESLRSGTSIKVRFLVGAGACQIAAVAALGACTLAVL